MKKVAGDFHVAAGEKRDEKDALVYKIDLRKLSEFDVTHKIERLVFGDQDVSINDVEGNPLNIYQSQGEGTMTQLKYHITIVRCVCFLSVEPGVIQNTHRYPPSTFDSTAPYNDHINTQHIWNVSRQIQHQLDILLSQVCSFDTTFLRS